MCDIHESKKKVLFCTYVQSDDFKHYAKLTIAFWKFKVVASARNILIIIQVCCFSCRIKLHINVIIIYYLFIYAKRKFASLIHIC